MLPDFHRLRKPIKKSNIVYKHGLADHSVEATLEKLRTAQRVMNMMEERERVKKEAFLRYMQMENLKMSQSSLVQEERKAESLEQHKERVPERNPSVEKVQKPVQKQEQQETVQPRPSCMRR